MFRIGFGTDIHRLVEGRRLVIGAVTIESAVGADGHSDADVLMHAVTDALLGALALGDIGTHFPDSEPRWRNAESSEFLLYAVGLVKERGFHVVNVDATVDLESPKLRPFIDQMRENIADLLDVDMSCVSIKAKTGEGVDAVGEGRAIRAQAVVIVSSNSETTDGHG
ncbi:MAG: 2-C-methyl-D-erythritol 2,4-cyclodiphosphate synthase [Pyrinomonadaceae bacterium]